VFEDGKGCERRGHRLVQEADKTPGWERLGTVPSVLGPRLEEARAGVRGWPLLGPPGLSVRKAAWGCSAGSQEGAPSSSRPLGFPGNRGGGGG
jgi:hypothetical protein